MSRVRKRTSASWSFGLLVAACLLAVSSPAWAQKQDARRHYEEATAAFGLGRYLDAAEHYEQAFRIRPDRAFLYNAAQAYRLGGNKARALELYRNYIRLYADAPNIDDARQHALDLEQELRALEAVTLPPATSSSTGVLAPPVAPATSAATPAMGGPSSGRATSLGGGATSGSPPPGAVDLHLGAAPSSSSSGTAGDEGGNPSLIHRPWFWVAMGVVVGGAVVAVLLTTSDKNPKGSLGVITVGGN